MKARRLLASATHDPQHAAVIEQAFAEAWAGMAGGYSTYPSVAEAVRLRLAEAILLHAPTFWDDVEALKRAALRDLKTNVP